ncbi:CrcB family protein [Corynebacterium godavarianum]|uniref:Fluoride-specific ion channel FluC n=1 Tax=Corynebacterium godavarianum TaxID=2054421 RepID=A0ABY3E3Y7_9CORY|nr:CrcB family protein [Corynebacterium godavarianum]MBL7286587.1 CrcB family protein [Corynebacterium godavarianum]TSJ74323.1 CrcB family protein [Corynebacterium godavarianum]
MPLLIWTTVAIFAGAFAGGVSRWALAHIPAPRMGTWAANMIACSVLGFVAAQPGLVPLAVGTGFAGALSTWSTLAKELGQLIRDRNWSGLVRYTLATAVLSLVAAGFGLRWGALAFG